MDELVICGKIAESGLFDHDWYLAQYPDVAESGMDPILHYVRHGEKENRLPSASATLRRFPAHGKSSGNKLYDFIISGENREAGSAVPIVLAANDNYVKYSSVTIASIIANSNPGKNYEIYLLNTDITAEHCECLEEMSTRNVRVITCNVKYLAREIINHAPTFGYITHETYFRFFIPDILNTENKCVYLDSDLVINRDIYSLFSMDISKCLLGAVPSNWEDPENLKYRSTLAASGLPDYFNAGVLLINILNFRLNNIISQCMELYFNDVVYKYLDQDILNIVCERQVKLLHQTWNCCFHYYFQEAYKWSRPEIFRQFAECYKKPNIVHYPGPRKPWNMDDGHFCAMWWRYARLSPWFEQLVKECGMSLHDIWKQVEKMEERDAVSRGA